MGRGAPRVGTVYVEMKGSSPESSGHLFRGQLRMGSAVFFSYSVSCSAHGLVGLARGSLYGLGFRIAQGW